MEVILVPVIVVAFVVVVTWYIISKELKTWKLRKVYLQALKGTDKKAAIEAGRAWCIASRKYKMVTDWDEKMIAEAVSKMRNV